MATASRNGICSVRTAICRPARGFFDRTKRSPFALLAVFLRVVAALRREQAGCAVRSAAAVEMFVGVAGWLAGVRNRVSAYHGPLWSANQTLMNLDAFVGWLGFYTQMVACGNSVAETFRAQKRRYAPVAVVVNGQNIPQRYPRAEARAALGLPPRASSSARSAG